MIDKLTKQDKKFIENVVETGNLTESAQEAYNIEDPNYAGVKGHRLIRKDKIANALQEALPDNLLQEKHLQFLNSDREEIGIKALDLGYKLKGAYAPDKSLNLNVNLDDGLTDAEKEGLRKLLKQ